MLPGLVFQSLFLDVLPHQVEYSYGREENHVTTMIPLRPDLLPRVAALATRIPFAGEWAWAISRFTDRAAPDEYLLRLDWLAAEVTGVTLYCRFPTEPDDAAFARAMMSARPFGWSGPAPSALAAALGAPGPRGIAFRATRNATRRTALYFRSEEHVGPAWTGRLTGLLAACRYPAELATTIEAHLKALYLPGPVGVIGVDDGEQGIPGSLKFDPASVSLRHAFAFLAGVGVPPARLDALRRIAIGLRAESVTYTGMQYGREGFSAWRLYFSCQPLRARSPGRIAMETRRHLRPVRRLPHY